MLEKPDQTIAICTRPLALHFSNSATVYATMNTRQAIQASNTPAVLSLSFSSSRSRFVAGLSDGLRVFRSDNCLTTYQPSLPNDGGLAIVEALDDRYLAFVGGGRSAAFSPNVVVFWDCVIDQEVNRFDFYEPVHGLRLSRRYMVVILEERTVVFEYRELEPRQEATPPPDMSESADTMTGDAELRKGPNALKACHATSPNAFALACLRHDSLVLPAQAAGQIQLIPLAGGSKRVMKVHNSALRCMTLSPDGTVLATASETGTLIRVFDTKTQGQLAEFRRGVDHAIIYDLVISDTNRWLACTSDKGTVHMFDLRPAAPDTNNPSIKSDIHHRKSHSQSHTHPQQPRTYHLSSGVGTNQDQQSLLSSAPSSRPSIQPQAYQGSIQEYYGLRPPPLSSTPHNTTPAGPSAAAYAAFKASPLAPRIMNDVRSIASAPFATGDESPHWQGGAAHSWTMTPEGTRKRVTNPVLPLSGTPSGRPRKGVLAFAPAEGDEAEGCRLWVVGGGSDARWEVFDLVPVQGGGGWMFVKGGFRRYLTRQFVD